MSKYATINPATGEVVQGFDTMSDADADRALTRAHQAYLGWRTIELKERAAVLGRVADLFRQNATDLAELTTLEMGKPITQAKGEVELSAAIFDYYATKGPGLLADEILDIAGSGRAIVRTAPIGPLLGIMPYPHAAPSCTTSELGNRTCPVQLAGRSGRSWGQHQSSARLPIPRSRLQHGAARRRGRPAGLRSKQLPDLRELGARTNSYGLET